MSHPKTPKGQGHNQHDDTRQGSQEGADGGYGERSLPIQKIEGRQVVNEHGRNDEGEEIAHPAGVDVHGVGDHLGSAIGEDVDELDGLDRPKSDGGPNDEEATKESNLTDNDKGQVNCFALGPGDIELSKTVNQNGSPLQNTSQTAHNKLGTKNLKCEG